MTDRGRSDGDGSAPPRCPNCGVGVLFVVTDGPGEHVAVPCGCELGTAVVRDLPRTDPEPDESE